MTKAGQNGVFLHEGGSNAEQLEKDFLNTWHVILKNGEANVFAATTDTTGNMNSFGMRMEKHGFHHICCSDHVMHLTASLVIKSKKNKRLEEAVGEELVESIEKARAHVKCLNKSTQGLKKLKSLQTGKKTPLGVVVDIITRWWSSLDMMERMIDLKEFIDQMRAGGHLESVDEMTSNDWANINDIKSVLKPFKLAMQVVEGNKHVTASTVVSLI